MPTTKSAQKAFRKNIRLRARNARVKNTLKSLVGNFRARVKERKENEARELLPKIYKAFDKAAKVGVVKTGHAARKKSRLARSLSALANPKTAS